MSLADCFAYDRTLIPVSDAQSRLRAHAKAVTSKELVPLGAALGRILAEDIISPRNVPSFDNAAVDGWAFAWAETAKQTSRVLRITPGRAAAGHAFKETLAADCCLRVLTGAVMPKGSDTVALQEEVRVEAGQAFLPAALKRYANRRPAGEDMAKDAVILKAGHRLRSVDVGALALLGLAQIPVATKLRVAVFSTGDELLEPGMPAMPGRTFDANRHILMSLLEQLPVELCDLGCLRDDRQSVETALTQAASNFDLVLTSGGASQGDEDHVAAVLAAQGQVHFWRIALKPGRPLAFGQIGQALFVGLPGNPVAATVCFALFGRPVLLALAGQPWTSESVPQVAAGFDLRKQVGRTEMIRVRLIMEGDEPVAMKIPKQGSGVLTSLVEATGLLEVGPTIERVEPGLRLPYRDFASLGLA